MDIAGEYLIQAPRPQVWEALNDPEVLKQCIPGCESIEKTSDTTLAAKVTAKIGPVKAKFTGEVTLSNMNPPESYTITGEGKGGPAGFAKGGADVHLVEESGDTTRLSYKVHANVGGKIAQLGARLVQGTARKMADEFFGRFSEVVGGAPAEPLSEELAAPADAVPAEASPEEMLPAEAAAEETPPPVEDKGEWRVSPVKAGATAARAGMDLYASHGATPEHADAAADHPVEGEADLAPSAHPHDTAPHDGEAGLPPWVWVAAIIVVAVILIVAFG
ncbi:MAG: carbon monoxide dehydrogenase [Rhodospirillaceae bacterium]|nr:carbon monoxide dehydrogenase [Rhodospirillaceae bacterium]